MIENILLLITIKVESKNCFFYLLLCVNLIKILHKLFSTFHPIQGNEPVFAQPNSYQNLLKVMERGKKLLFQSILQKREEEKKETTFEKLFPFTLFDEDVKVLQRSSLRQTKLTRTISLQYL